ncbi:MAG: response regulator transcription factor [Actinomycetes bacterium]
MPRSRLVIVADAYALDSQVLSERLSSVSLTEAARPEMLEDVDLRRVDLLLLDADCPDDVFLDATERAQAVGLLYDRDTHVLRRRGAAPAVQLTASRATPLTDLCRLIADVLDGHVRKVLPEARRPVDGSPSLSPRESEVLHLMARGLGNRDIADTLRISPHTVRTHVQAVLAKFNKGSRVTAVGAARAAGLLSL